jgi:hypothetical protein
MVIGNKIQDIKKNRIMKKLKFSIIIFVAIIAACSSDNNDVNLDEINAPTNISALITITQDNSGKVTILPKGEGVTQYEIQFGDATTESAFVNPGGTVQHIYQEGTYQVKIIGMSLNGKTTEITQEVTISFLPPTDLVVTITPGATLSVTVSATANLETFFQVYYGESPTETPVNFMQGETVSHVYLAPGTYQIRVVALSGGVATTEYIQNVTVTNLTPAPVPTIPAGSVISMFSDTYTNVPVDTWRTSWSSANLTDVTISGNAAKKYSNLNFVGVEATTTPINATAMTYFHTDVWSSDFTQFKVKLVDFGANATFGGGDDKEHEITISSPAQNTWVSLDIPLSAFTGLTTRAHIAQLIYVASPSGSATVYVDNVFFYNLTASLTTAAPTPTLPASNVISMFSGAYTNVPVDTWRTSWSNATFADVSIAGNPTKKYSALDFVGIETVTNQINATSMTHFHTDVWSADFTVFRIKLVDFGANGIFAGGDDKEHEIVFSSPAQGGWISIDIPLSNFTGLTTRAHIAQLIYSATPTGSNTVYVDNVYFHN